MTIGFTEDLELTPVQFIDQFCDKLESKYDAIWLLCRKQFMNDKSLRLFAVWCARNAIALIESPDNSNINAINIAESYAFDNCNIDELNAAAAYAANAAYAAYADARNKQVLKLREWFETEDYNVFLDNK